MLIEKVLSTIQSSKTKGITVKEIETAIGACKDAIHKVMRRLSIVGAIDTMTVRRGAERWCAMDTALDLVDAEVSVFHPASVSELAERRSVDRETMLRRLLTLKHLKRVRPFVEEGDRKMWVAESEFVRQDDVPRMEIGRNGRENECARYNECISRFDLEQEEDVQGQCPRGCTYKRIVHDETIFLQATRRKY